MTYYTCFEWDDEPHTLTHYPMLSYDKHCRDLMMRTKLNSLTYILFARYTVHICEDLGMQSQ